MLYLNFNINTLPFGNNNYNPYICNMEKYSNKNLAKELLLDTKSYAELARIYSISRPTVRAYARRLGLHKGNTQRLKSHSLNLSYFKSIDTPNKAYVLGFIYADGCNTRKGLQIGIQEEDKEVLEFIKKELQASNNLKFIKPYKTTWSAKWELAIKSMELSNDLTNVGCPPAKSLILEFPTFIKDELMSHFIRGYFDGDGGISICSKNYKRINFTCGSEVFIKALRKFLEEKTGYKLPLYKGKAYSLASSKQALVKAIVKFMYTDSTFSLQRKYKKACDLMVEIER